MSATYGLGYSATCAQPVNRAISQKRLCAQRTSFEGRVRRLPVGGGHHNDLRAVLKAVHLRQHLVQGLIPLIVPLGARPTASISSMKMIAGARLRACMKSTASSWRGNLVLHRVCAQAPKALGADHSTLCKEILIVSAG